MSLIEGILTYITFTVFLLSILYSIKKYLYVRKAEIIRKISGIQYLSLTFAVFAVIAIILLIPELSIEGWFIKNISDVFMITIWLINSIMFYNYDFIIKDGVFIGGRFIKWSSIQSWKWKEWHENVALISYRNKKGKLRTMKFNVSKKHAREFEETLNEFVLKGK